MLLTDKFISGPLSSTHQFHTKRPLLFSPKIPKFHTENPSVPPPQFHTNSLSSKQFLSDGCVDLRAIWRGT